ATIGWSKPYFAFRAATAWGLASCPSIISAGLPSRPVTQKNSSAETISAVGIIRHTRRTIRGSMGGSCHSLPGASREGYGIPNPRDGKEAPMRFGYFHNPHDVTRQRDWGDLLEELRELAQLCDRLGFDTFWLPEHHFSIWGRE